MAGHKWPAEVDIPPPIPYEAMMRLILPSILALIAFSGVAAQSETAKSSSSGDTPSHDQQPSDTHSETGSAIVEVVTEPDIGSDTLRFTGTPGGLISLRLGRREQLVADNLAAGSYTSKLAVIGPVLAAQGFRLDSISCDDEASPLPSTGDVPTQTATFNVENGEKVTCQFMFKFVDSDCTLPARRIVDG